MNRTVSLDADIGEPESYHTKPTSFSNTETQPVGKEHENLPNERKIKQQRASFKVLPKAEYPGHIAIALHATRTSLMMNYSIQTQVGADVFTDRRLTNSPASAVLATQLWTKSTWIDCDHAAYRMIRSPSGVSGVLSMSTIRMAPCRTVIVMPPKIVVRQKVTRSAARSQRALVDFSLRVLRKGDQLAILGTTVCIRTRWCIMP